MWRNSPFQVSGIPTYEAEEAALALLEELKRLRVEGVTDVFVEEESLLALTNALGNSPKAIKSAPEVTAPSVSVPQKTVSKPSKRGVC